MKILGIISLLFLTSCVSFYRATIGSGNTIGRFKSSVLDESGNEVEKEICVKATDSVSTDQCSGGGVKDYNTKGKLDGMVETVPQFFGSSSWGWSNFFAFNNFSTTLVDYPTNDEETKVTVSRVALNPFIFYNFGDNVFNGGKGFSVRIGSGLSLSYQFELSFERSSTGETIKSEDPFQIGSASFFEICWNWLTIRSEFGQIYLTGAKFSGISDTKLTVNTGKVGLYYTYYF